MSARFSFDSLLACTLRLINTNKDLYIKWHDYMKADSFYPSPNNPQERALKKILHIIEDEYRYGKFNSFSINTLETILENAKDSEEKIQCISLVRRMKGDNDIISKSRDDGVLLIFMDYLKVLAIQNWAKIFGKDYQEGRIDSAINKMRELLPELDRMKLATFEKLDPAKIFENIKKRAEHKNTNFKIGIPALDGETSGWYEPSTLNVFVGATGSGKSMMTINILYQAILQQRYAHLTCVEDKLSTIETRLLASLTDIPIGRLKGEPEKLTSEELRKIKEAQAKIAEFIEIDFIYGENVDSIHAEKIANDERRRLAGKPVSEIDIIDYTGHIAKHSVGDKDYERLKNAYGSRKDFALKYKKIAFDFVQVNREGNRKNSSGNGLLTEADFAGAYDISHVCDTIVTINRSAEQAQSNQASLYVTKGREGGKGFRVDVETAFKCGKFINSVTNVET